MNTGYGTQSLRWNQEGKQLTTGASTHDDFPPLEKKAVIDKKVPVEKAPVEKKTPAGSVIPAALSAGGAGNNMVEESV